MFEDKYQKHCFTSTSFYNSELGILTLTLNKMYVDRTCENDDSANDGMKEEDNNTANKYIKFTLHHMTLLTGVSETQLY